MLMCTKSFRLCAKSDEKHKDSIIITTKRGIVSDFKAHVYFTIHDCIPRGVFTTWYKIPTPGGRILILTPYTTSPIWPHLGQVGHNIDRCIMTMTFQPHMHQLRSLIIRLTHNNNNQYGLHTEVQVSMRFTLLRDAGPRWCKKHRD